MNRIALTVTALLLLAAPAGLADTSEDATSQMPPCALVQVSPWSFPYVTLHPDCITAEAPPQP